MAVNNRTITAANTIFTLAVQTIFPAPVRIQGYSADNVTGSASIATKETPMGVDGRLSSGWVPVPIVQSITLQADSLSNDFFENWYNFEQQVREAYAATGLLIFPATGKKYALTRGFLTDYKPFPDAAKVLQARPFSITWQSVTAAPL
jgi:hypothetical protein